MKELETERLLLRRVVPSDTHQMFENWTSDPDVARYVTWNAHTDISATEKFMEFIQNRYASGEKYIYGMELKSDGTLFGMIEVVAFHDEKYPVIGYCSGKKQWGHGYMTEALKALVKLLFEDGYEKILIGAIKENIGSIRVIEKAGFTYTGSEEKALSASKPDIVTINHYSYLKTDYYKK